MQYKISDFAKAKIVVVGDVMLDRYWYGSTSRISPEAPVPVVHINESMERPGGAGNVALNIKAFDAEATLLSIIGDDSSGKKLKNILEETGVNCFLSSIPEFPTIKKLRVLSQNQQLLRLDFEENFCKADMRVLIKDYQEQLSNSNLVIVSDYGKGIASVIPELINLALKKDIPILVDPKNRDFNIYRGATLITPNLHEFEQVVGPCASLEILAKKGKDLLETYKIQNLLITRGAEGMTLIQTKNDPVHISALTSEVYDVTGAGDTVIASVGVALASGADLTTAVQIANIAASIVVKKLGAASVTISELRREIHNQENLGLGIISEDLLWQEVNAAKAAGERIVMTNGCFDILHAGHISYLEQAKALGDRLIVAVNDDESVQRLKGIGRPINKLANRMIVLASLRAVDWVVPFSEDTPTRIISKITPNILVKGGDYQSNEVAGGEHVIKHGGIVEILGFTESCSSTNIIDKIKGVKN